MEKETFANRLNAALTIRGLKPAELSKISGISKSSISEYLKGKFKPRQDGVYILSKSLNVSEPWLMGYDVSMGRISEEIESNIFPTPDTVVAIPVVGRISAGMPLLAVENIIRYDYAPSSQIKRGYTYFYLTVQGDSMNKKFHEGDIILVQKQDDLENDEIGVVMIDGEATVKKYKNENGLIKLEPMSNNPKNKIQEYNPKEVEIKIIGKVISYQGKV